MNKNTENRNNARTPEGRGKFPFVPIIVILIAFMLLIYSAFGIFVFARTFRSSSLSQETENTMTLEDGSVVERGNLKFTTAEVFNIDDPSSTGGTILLFTFCTLSIASIVALVFAYRSIVKSRVKRSAKIIIAAVCTVVSILAGLFLTYQMTQAQLDWFKSKKDDAPIDRNTTNVDSNGDYYLLDGNGDPYLSLQIAEENVTDEKYSAVAKYLNITEIEYLYVICEFTKDEKGTIEITGFNIDDSAGAKRKVDLKCLSSSGDKDIFYELNANGMKLKYKLLTSGSDISRSDPDAKTTFLIVGKDRVGSNTDVMMLISLYTENDDVKADILQIPRDTYCRDNSLNNKINSIYASFRRDSSVSTETERIFAGMNGLKSVLERNWLIKIDYWAIMNLDGFGKIVDGIGGVDMYVPFDMNYDDPTAVPELHIHLKEGQQTLHAAQAEQFIRYRKGYVTGDLGRVDATKLFLTAFFCKLREELSITNPGALTSTITTLMDYVTTNMDTGNAISFVKMVLKLNLENITFINLPGSDYAKAPDSKASYYTSNRRGMYYVVNKYFNVYDEDINENEFDASRMFTTQKKYTELDNAHNAKFDVEEYEKTLKGADQIQQEQENKENNLPVIGGLRR